MNQNNQNRQSQENPQSDQEELKRAAGDNEMEIKMETPEGVGIQDVEESDDPNDQIQGLEAEILKLNENLEKEKKEYLFLMAEFDNFRKRTLKEKSEIVKNAAESALKGMLPILDDFERGLKATENASDASGIREGMELIYNKFVKYLEQNGVKAMDTEAGKDFDTELHEAISIVPTGDEAQKGKILDTVQKGYTINGKVLRHAKVVVGQ